MTTTLANPALSELDPLLEVPPRLPEEITEQSLTFYVGYYRKAQQLCDYQIGLALEKAHEQWAGVQGSTKGRFRAWCAANTHLIKSNEEAYRLMNWAKNVHAQNLRESLRLRYSCANCAREPQCPKFGR